MLNNYEDCEFYGNFNNLTTIFTLFRCYLIKLYHTKKRDYRAYNRTHLQHLTLLKKRFNVRSHI